MGTFCHCHSLVRRPPKKEGFPFLAVGKQPGWPSLKSWSCLVSHFPVFFVTVERNVQTIYSAAFVDGRGWKNTILLFLRQEQER